MRTLTLSLSTRQAERIKEAVRSGDYASNSDVLRDAIRLWEEQQDLGKAERARLKQAYDEGKASGAPAGTTKAELLASARLRASGRG